MKVMVDYRNYVNERGDFELPRYLYLIITNLMKQALDFGTMLSNDPAKLRAYKEQTKRSFKAQWFDLAQALESFGIIVVCGCPPDEFCRACGGARYVLNEALSPDQMREVSVVVGQNGNDPELARKLQEGMKKAMREVAELGTTL